MFSRALKELNSDMPEMEYLIFLQNLLLLPCMFWFIIPPTWSPKSQTYKCFFSKCSWMIWHKKFIYLLIDTSYFDMSKSLEMSPANLVLFQLSLLPHGMTSSSIQFCKPDIQELWSTLPYHSSIFNLMLSSVGFISWLCGIRLFFCFYHYQSHSSYCPLLPKRLK